MREQREQKEQREHGEQGEQREPQKLENIFQFPSYHARKSTLGRRHRTYHNAIHQAGQQPHHHSGRHCFGYQHNDAVQN